jgi:hypothetical protein
MQTKTLAISLVIIASCVILGFGCAAAEPETSFDTSGEPNTTLPQVTKDSTELTPSDTNTNISFTATPTGGGIVELQWTIENTPQSEIDAFRFIRSQKPDPAFDRMNYWWETPNYRRSTTWRDIPPGTYHMRACIVRHDECITYSADQVVEVK